MVVLKTACCIVGGGPAGMMLGFLLARAGVEVVVLEKHKDFLRDFRGDTIHPSTMELMHEMGLLEEFLRIPHDRIDAVKLSVEGRPYRLGDFSHLPTRAKYIALMPQWDFLNFLADKGRGYPKFLLMMETQGTDLIMEGAVVRGVEARTAEGQALRIEARLTVACDGRRSILRAKAGLAVQDFQVPIDVLWLRIPKDPSLSEKALGYIQGGRLMVLIDRRDYFQCGYIIPKGGYDRIKAEGLPALKASMVHMAPFLEEIIDTLQSWEQISLLTVTVDRLRRWFLPGLLCIGDAAHAMSPAGGVGINLAIQDAVATANLLWRPLKEGGVRVRDLEAVQRRRLWPTRVIQAAQVYIHRRFINANIDQQVRLPGWLLWLLQHVPLFQRLPAYLVGIGPRPEHIHTPEASIEPQ